MHLEPRCSYSIIGRCLLCVRYYGLWIVKRNCLTHWNLWIYSGFCTACRYEIICDPCSSVMQNRRSDVKAEQLVKLFRAWDDILMERKKKLFSLVQVLKVSISLAAQINADIDPDSPCIQPVCEMLHPQFPSWMTASSLSSSSAFDVLTSPSEDPDRIILWLGSSLEGAYDKVVVLSEWVGPWIRRGVVGCRGSLIEVF